MGWKCALLYASEREPGYLGTLPQHLPEKATELKIALGMPDLRSEGMEILESAIHPDTQFLFLGAYDRTFLITSHIMSDLDELTSNVVYLEEGKILFNDTIDLLKEETGELKLGRAIATIMKRNINETQKV